MIGKIIGKKIGKFCDMYIKKISFSFRFFAHSSVVFKKIPVTVSIDNGNTMHKTKILSCSLKHADEHYEHFHNPKSHINKDV